jgi:Flp pilus assembly protein TadB
MYINENRFNIAFHKKEVWKYNLIFEITTILFIAILVMSILYFRHWMLFVAIIVELFLFLFGVKMRTLRDVNMFAVRTFEDIYKNEFNNMFR